MYCSSFSVQMYYGLFRQNFLVHLSKSVLSSAAISTGQPIAVENVKAFMCIAKAVLSLSKSAAHLQKRTPTMEDIDIATVGLHDMVMERSGKTSIGEIGHALVDMCLANDLKPSSETFTAALAKSTEAAAVKTMAKKGITITPKALKKTIAAFAGNTINAVKTTEKISQVPKGECPNNCTNHGTCDGASSTCECENNYLGYDCALNGKAVFTYKGLTNIPISPVGNGPPSEIATVSTTVELVTPPTTPPEKGNLLAKGGSLDVVWSIAPIVTDGG